ncbi:lectin-like domain-containing protein [Luteolibacter luteus]|uniref:F5/8 type C domain-containing protein n=1 Tax=Luteolibacter luteus TaxID=2728835 RepID=A0A858RER2_9BACT|nr:hypothetical protein [Luteolibacter luteus]QJE94899.1 hypothetical protein HHL09_03595 [Luteolibacter luteus]
MKTQNIPLWGRGAFALILTAATATSLEAAEKTHRYFKFEQTKLRGAANSIQLAEFQLKLGATVLPMTSVTVTNPGGNSPGGEPPANVKDGSVETKWLDFNKEELVFDFGSAVTVDGYNFATANDAPERDPVSWLFYGSDDGTNWIPLDVRADQAITTVRKTYEVGWIIPESIAPQITAFSTSKFVAINGSTNVTANWTTLLADTVTLSGYGTVAGTGSQVLTLANNTDTPLTLTATNSFGAPTVTTTVRTVAGGSATYQYVRFTPVKLRDDQNANSIQLAELFLKNGATVLPVFAASNEEGGNSPGAEGPDKLIDNNLDTKWLDFSKGAVVLEFTEPTTFDSYGFATANDAEARDPVRWILEGSDDLENWTMIDNLTAFDAPITLARKTYIPDVPLPGASLIPFATMSGETKVISGEPMTLVWRSGGGVTVTLNGNSVAASGSMDVSPTADTTYTLTVTSAGALVATSSVEVDVIDPAIDEIDYANFDAAGDEIALLGQSEILNDFANRPAPGDFKRLRITPDEGSVTGAAWFRKRLDFSEGFETNFDLHLVTLTTTNNAGADGIAFVIHNDPLRTQAFPPDTQENGLPANALNITFDTHQNEAEPSAATIEVRDGQSLLQSVNLADFPEITLGGTPEAKDLTRTDGNVAPYKVRITYVPGDLDVYFEGVLVIANLEVNLADAFAVNEEGLGYAGFTARTGGFFEAHDVTRWKLVEGVPVAPPVLTSYTVTGGATPSATLNWSSSTARTYRVTTSTDLVDWSNVLQSGIAGHASGTNSISVSLPVAQKVFVRVEEE